MKIEVPVTLVGKGKDRELHFDCPKCHRRVIVGKIGAIVCGHSFVLRPRKMDEVVAIFDVADHQ